MNNVARSVLVVLLIICVIAGYGGSASAAPSADPGSRAADAGSIGVRLVDVPVATSDDPRAQVYIVDHVAPGTVIRRRIEVSNTTTGAVEVALYPAAATIANGSFLGSVGHTPNDLSTWTSVSPAAPDIPASGRVTATATITVPHDAAPGEQYGVVWAEARSAPGAGGGVTQVSRVGIRLYVDVGPGGPPAANFTIDSLTAKRSADGKPMVLASVHNTGGRALDMNGNLRLLGGPGGLSAGPFPAVLGTTLAIGDTESVTIVLDKQLPAGPWDAQIALRSGLLERSARATITFTAVGTAPPVITSPNRPGWLYPAIAIAVLLLLVMLAFLILLWRRRKTRGEVPDEDLPGGQNNDPTNDSDGHDQTAPRSASRRNSYTPRHQGSGV